MDKTLEKHNAPTWQYDIVRGFMCLFIFNCHFLAMFNLPQLPVGLQYIKSFLSNAHLGGIYFFMLSGTVLSMSFLRKKVSVKSFPQFILKRFLRLLPPILISLVVAYVLMCCKLVFIDQLGQVISLNSWAKTLYSFNPDDLSPIRDILDTYLFGHSGYNANLWIIRFEFLVPLLLLFAYKFAKFRVVRLAVVLAIVGVMGGYVFMNIDKMLLLSYVLMFFLGLVIAYKSSMETYSSKTVKLMMYTAIILMVFSVLFCESVSRLLDIVLCSLLLIAMYHKTFVGIKKLAKVPFVKTLGKVSYEFFVYHLCVIASFSCWVFLQLYGVCGYCVALLLTYLLTVIIVYAMSCLSNYLTARIYNPIIKNLF